VRELESLQPPLGREAVLFAAEDGLEGGSGPQANGPGLPRSLRSLAVTGVGVLLVR